MNNEFSQLQELHFQELKDKIDAVIITGKMLGYTFKKSGNIYSLFKNLDDRLPFLELKMYTVQPYIVLRTKLKGHSVVKMVTNTHREKIDHLTNLLQKL